MDELDQWLKCALEESFGSLVREKILSHGESLDYRAFDAVSDEIVDAMFCSNEMSEFKTKWLKQEGEYGIAGRNHCVVSHRGRDWCEEALSEKKSSSRVSSSHLSPLSARSERSREPGRFSGSDRRPRSHLSRGQRIQALEVLSRVPVADIVGSANWPQLQQELCESLCDENWTVFQQVLKVLTRLASSTTFSPVREGFLSLLEGLTLYYLTCLSHQQLPSALHGIQLNIDVHRRIIQMSHCLLQVLRDLPRKWIRFGEKRTQELMENFVDLLSMHTHHHRVLGQDKRKEVLYPFHIFSVLDPEAKWARGVMHACFGRNVLMKCVIKTQSLVRFILEEAMLWLRAQMLISDGALTLYECGRNGNINGNVVHLTVFIHSISLLKHFINCDYSHLTFPVATSIQEEPISIYSLVLAVIEFLNKISNESELRHSEKLVNILEDVSSSLILSQGSRILHGSSVKLINLLLEVPNKIDQTPIHSHNINILCKISESPVAIRWMLGRPMRRVQDGIARGFSDLKVPPYSAGSSTRESHTTNKYACIAERVAKVSTSVIKNRSRFTPDSTASVHQLLSLSEKLFSTPEGFLILETSDVELVPSAGQLYLQLSIKTRITEQGLCAELRYLEDLLMGITRTPLGFLAVLTVENLLEVLISSNLEIPNKNKSAEANLLHLVQLLSSVPHAKLQKIEKSFMKHALTNLWSMHESDSNWAWVEAKHQFLSIVLSLCSNVSIILRLLDEADDSSSDSTLVEATEPLSLRELLEIGLHQEVGCNPEWQEVCMMVLHALVHNFSIASSLQERLKLKECLQRILSDSKIKGVGGDVNVQPSPRKDKNSHVYDANTRTVCHILVILNNLRDTSPCEFSASLVSPRSPRPHAYTSRPRMQTELQRFLQDTRQGLHDSMWMSHARRAYRASCRTELKIPVLMDLLDQVLLVQSLPSFAELPFKWPSGPQNPCHSLQTLRAIDVVIRYGCQIKVLSVNMINQHVEQLSLLLQQTKTFSSNSSDNENFDWFACSVFLMCTGSIDRSRSLLQRIALLPSAPFLWPALSQNANHLTASISQHLQALLAEYVPRAYNVLLEAGVPWWLVTERLTAQAYLPNLPLAQLSHIIALLALHPWEYHLYIHTAMFAHLQPALLRSSLQHSIHALLTEIRLDTFAIGDYLPFMDKMAKLNRPHLVRDRISTATL